MIYNPKSEIRNLGTTACIYQTTSSRGADWLEQVDKEGKEADREVGSPKPACAPPVLAILKSV